jgi:protein TonB
MSRILPSQGESQGSWLSVLLGICVALFILLMVPFAQLLKPDRERVVVIEQADVAPPPPLPFNEPPPPPPKREAEPPPELKLPPPMPSLEQLEIGLNAGTGGNLGIDLDLGINFSTESVEQLESIFGFGELDEIPRVVRAGQFRYPTNGPRGRGQKFVNLLIIIDVNGRVSVQDVVDFSHRELIEPAKRMAMGTRFSVPVRNGEPVRARYEWPIQISLE